MKLIAFVGERFWQDTRVYKTKDFFGYFKACYIWQNMFM